MHQAFRELVRIQGQQGHLPLLVRDGVTNVEGGHVRAEGHAAVAAVEHARAMYFPHLVRLQIHTK